MLVLCLAQQGSLGVIFVAVLNNSVYRVLEVGGKRLEFGPLKCDLVDYPCSGVCNTGDVVWLCSLMCGFTNPSTASLWCPGVEQISTDFFSDGCLHWKHSHVVEMNPTQKL